MAPQKGTKRGDAKSAVPAEKRPKNDPHLNGVIAALEGAELPQGCRQMFKACLTHAFITPCGERHESQIEVVKMIGEVMESSEAKLKKAADEENAKVTDVEASKSELQAALAEAEVAQATATKEVEAKTAAAAEATTTVKSAKSSLQEVEEVQRTGDAGLLKAQESKAALDKGLESNLQPIIDGQGEPEQHYQALLPLLGNLGLDDSMMNALPSTCKKTAADRGAFDTMVLEQLGTCLREHVAKFAKTIAEATPAAQERAGATEAARGALAGAEAKQAKAAEALEGAKAGQEASIAKVKDAGEKLAAFEPEYVAATMVRDAKATDLENFRLYNMACFAQLRDNASPKVAGGGA